MKLHIDLEKKIQVRNKGKYEYVSIKSIGLLSNEDIYMIVMFNDFTEKTIVDIFGTGYDEWRYAERSCNQCIYNGIEGGDYVPYGNGTIYTPESHVCNCPDVNLEDHYNELEEGSKCEHFEADVAYTGISSEDFRSMCIHNNWCTACSLSQYNRLFEMLKDGTDLNTIALLVSMFSVDVSEKEVLQNMACFCNERRVELNG